MLLYQGKPHPFLVALLAEGVDRNWVLRIFSGYGAGSPSSRRAWIEIRELPRGRCGPPVALLMEGVDRNERTPDMVFSLERRPPRGGRG